MKYFGILFCLFVISTCNAQKKASKSKLLPLGKWVCIQDTLSTMIVKGNYIFRFYNNLATDSSKYYITTTSCDKTYKSANKKPLYIKWYGVCSEVDYLTNTDLMLLYTANGQLSTFKKIK